MYKRQALYEADETVRDLIDKAKRLEGLPRHASVHASGVLISQDVYKRQDFNSG